MSVRCHGDVLFMRFSAGENHSADNDSTPTHIKHFVDHFITITWLTYRKDFPPIEGTRITTDCGWGCMVRSGQMLLATALNYHLLGRGICMHGLYICFKSSFHNIQNGDWQPVIKNRGCYIDRLIVNTCTHTNTSI